MFRSARWSCRSEIRYAPVPPPPAVYRAPSLRRRHRRQRSSYEDRVVLEKRRPNKSCNPESTQQLHVELRSTIERLLSEQLKRLLSESQSAIKAATLFSRNPQSKHYNQKQALSRFHSPSCHRRRDPSRRISARADTAGSHLFLVENQQLPADIW